MMYPFSELDACNHCSFFDSRSESFMMEIFFVEISDVCYCRTCSGSSCDLHWMLLITLLLLLTTLVFDERWLKTLVQLMPMVFTGSVIVGEGLELLFIKAMCIIDYIYMFSIFYHAFIMCAPHIGVRCWLLLFNKHCFLCIFIIDCINLCFVDSWLQTCDHLLIMCGFIGTSLRYACTCTCCQSSNPVYCYDQPSVMYGYCMDFILINLGCI